MTNCQGTRTVQNADNRAWRRHLGRVFAGKPPLSDPTLTSLVNPQWIEWIGTVAATLTTGSFLPQAWQTFRTRDVSGISLSMYTAFTLGVALWLVYGLAIGSWPVSIANMITLTLALSILTMKLAFGAKRARR